MALRVGMWHRGRVCGIEGGCVASRAGVWHQGQVCGMPLMPLVQQQLLKLNLVGAPSIHFPLTLKVQVKPDAGTLG